jgi:hypothetical protein
LFLTRPAIDSLSGVSVIGNLTFWAIRLFGPNLKENNDGWAKPPQEPEKSRPHHIRRQSRRFRRVYPARALQRFRRERPQDNFVPVVPPAAASTGAAGKSGDRRK